MTYGPDGPDEQLYGNFPSYSLLPSGRAPSGPPARRHRPARPPGRVFGPPEIGKRFARLRIDGGETVRALPPAVFGVTWSVPRSQMNQKVAVGAVFVAAMFMNIMDVTIVNVALPTIGREFRVRPDAGRHRLDRLPGQPGRVHTRLGWLGDRFGGRRVLLMSIVHLHRGVGPVRGGRQPRSAGVVPGRAGSRRRTDGAGRDGDALPDVSALGAGPSLEHHGHPHRPRSRPRAGDRRPVRHESVVAWVFYVNVPIGIAAFTFGFLVLVAQRQEHPGRFDLTRIRAGRRSGWGCSCTASRRDPSGAGVRR